MMHGVGDSQVIPEWETTEKQESTRAGFLPSKLVSPHSHWQQRQTALNILASAAPDPKSNVLLLSFHLEKTQLSQ